MTTNRLRPWTLAVGLGVVIAANGAFAYFGQGSSLESVIGHSFGDRNGHSRALDTVAEESAPGWTGKLHFRDGGDESGRIVFDLTDHAGKPLTDFHVKARAVRADEPASDVLVVMHESAPGRYVGVVELDRPGQWQILASAQRAADHLELSGQVTIK